MTLSGFPLNDAVIIALSNIIISPEAAVPIVNLDTVYPPK